MCGREWAFVSVFGGAERAVDLGVQATAGDLLVELGLEPDAVEVVAPDGTVVAVDEQLVPYARRGSIVIRMRVEQRGAAAREDGPGQAPADPAGVTRDSGHSATEGA